MTAITLLNTLRAVAAACVLLFGAFLCFVCLMCMMWIVCFMRKMYFVHTGRKPSAKATKKQSEIEQIDEKAGIETEAAETVSAGDVFCLND